MTSPTINVTTPLQDEGEEDELSLLPLPWSVIASLCIGVAIVTAVVGNLLVLLSYWRDPQLRDVHNLYLLHLAVCDFLLGALSMPLYLIYTVLYWTWPLGVVTCKVFLVEDFTLCAMSTLIVVLVAWDRLTLVTLGATYKVVETKARAYVRLAICWIFSFLLYSPAILLWDVVRGQSVVPHDDCDVEFNNDLVFTMVTEIISFSVPFISLTVVNALLFLALRKRVKIGNHQPQQHRLPDRHPPNIQSKYELTKKEPEENTSNSAAHPEPLSVPQKRPQTQENEPRTGESASSSIVSTNSFQSTNTEHMSSSFSQASSTQAANAVSPSQRSSQHVQQTASDSTGREVQKKNRSGAYSRDRRVAVILAGLVLALVVCWLPYSISTIILAACDQCVGKDLYEFFNWLLWLKSCVNPFLYAHNSPRFRKNFQELLGPVLPSKLRRRAARRDGDDHTDTLNTVSHRVSH